MYPFSRSIPNLRRIKTPLGEFFRATLLFFKKFIYLAKT
jgi:hypothetical protein